MKPTLSRRSFLKLSGLLACGATSTLAGCGGITTSAQSNSGLAGSGASAGTAPARPAPSKVVKAAFVFSSTIDDRGWTRAHNNARKYLEQTLGPQVETAYLESVPESDESQPVFEDFARKGYDIIYGDGFGFRDAMLAAAKKFPLTRFEHNTGDKIAPNLGTFAAAQEDARYVGGIVAGNMTSSNVLGFIASFPIPEVIRDLNSWSLGAKLANPSAQVRVIWINTWFDPPTEKAAANKLLDLGADVLASVTDSPAMAIAAASRKSYSIGSDSDQRTYAPDYMLMSAYYNWGIHYVRSVRSVLDGSWKPRQSYYHMKDGVSMATAPAKFMPPTVIKAADLAVEQLEAGNLNIWSGPIRDNLGAVIVPAGKTLGDIFTGAVPAGQTKTDAYVQSDRMNWLLDNIVDSLPG